MIAFTTRPQSACVSDDKGRFSHYDCLSGNPTEMRCNDSRCSVDCLPTLSFDSSTCQHYPGYIDFDMVGGAYIRRYCSSSEAPFHSVGLRLTRNYATVEDCSKRANLLFLDGVANRCGFLRSSGQRQYFLTTCELQTTGESNNLGYTYCPASDCATCDGNGTRSAPSECGGEQNRTSYC